MLVATSATAQTAPETWRIRSERAADSLDAVTASDSAEAVGRVLETLRGRGFVYARVDSVRGTSVYVTRGARADVRTIAWVGVDGVGRLDGDWNTREGSPFGAEALQRDLRRSADRLLAQGFSRAELVPRLSLHPDGVDLTIEVTPGVRARFAGVELVGGRNASRPLATRLSGRRVGSPFSPLDETALRRELEATGLFESIGEAGLVLDREGRLLVRVPVREGPPGSFDLVFGYLPPADGSPGGVVGSGRLSLRNPFGGGRRVDVALDRTPGLVSAFDVALSDPFVAGLPVRVTAAFSGYGRDSTFSRQRVRAVAGTRLARGLEVSVSVSRDAVAPGAYGATLVEGTSRITRSSGVFLGVGLAYRALDAPLNPRRGLSLDVTAEQGRRRRRPDPATGLASTSPEQRRIGVRARLFVPTVARHTAVLGADGDVVQTERDPTAGTSGVEGEGELVRFGGATSLRGYDEDAFVGRVVGRVFGEYRVLLGPQTYAFGFADLGYVDRPDLPGRPGQRQTAPGYGVGVQLRTGLGLATVTYALNPDVPAGRGKVHVGLSVGL